MPHRALLVLLAALAFAAADARADGLRIGAGLSALRYGDANVYVTSLSARVARGRASLTFGAPIIGISGAGAVVNNGDSFAVAPDEAPGASSELRFGPGDMSVALDYNLVQNREKMFVLALGGFVRFPTSPAIQRTSNGELGMGLGLSSFYGLTRQLFLFAEARQLAAGVFSPFSSRLRLGELGAVYWLTEGLGVSASVVAASYGEVMDPVTRELKPRLPASVEFNLGLMVEALPGMMMNLGGVGGIVGGAQAGGSFGFGFEI